MDHVIITPEAEPKRKLRWGLPPVGRQLTKRAKAQVADLGERTVQALGNVPEGTYFFGGNSPETILTIGELQKYIVSRVTQEPMLELNLQGALINQRGFTVHPDCREARHTKLTELFYRSIEPGPQGRKPNVGFFIAPEQYAADYARHAAQEQLGVALEIDELRGGQGVHMNTNKGTYQLLG